MTNKMGISPELYKAIVAIVDERVKEIRVTREDFNRLSEIVRELAQAQARTEKRVEELAQAQARTERAMANLTRQIGRLTDTVGYGLEDLGRWILPAYLERTYNITEIKRCIRKFIKVNGREIEINLYAEGKRDGKPIVVVGESKNRIRRIDVKNFITRLRTLEGVLNKRTFRFMFGYWIHPSAERLAQENGIEAISSYQLTR